MNELDFRKRLYVNPGDIEDEVRDAARDNPEYQKILDDTVAFEDSLGAQLESPQAPAAMQARLLGIPAEDAATGNGANVSPIRARKQSFFQYYAIAASLVLAVGIVISLGSNGGPSSADRAFGDELLAHLYHDNAEIDEITAGENYAMLALDEINSTMAKTGTRLASYDESQGFAVRSAKPCEILSAHDSAHLVLQGSKGAISVIVINNSPVDVQFSIRDERFEGIVLPMEQGNMVLVGEKNEDLSQYATLFADNVEWVI